MKLIETKLEGVKIIEPRIFRDDRGYFMESYNQDLFKKNHIDVNFKQDNHSFSKEIGVLRGLHYQDPPYAQTKLVRVISGVIFDVAVDLRDDSSTFGQWIGVILSEENHRQLLIPKGFAHGFCTLVANTEVLYKVDEFYSPEHDRNIIWNDPDIGIEWPTVTPILSPKDSQASLLREGISFSGEGVN